jgi:hypothetical protein
MERDLDQALEELVNRKGVANPLPMRPEGLPQG